LTLFIILNEVLTLRVLIALAFAVATPAAPPPQARAVAVARARVLRPTVIDFKRAMPRARGGNLRVIDFE
jgi:hypothetical protein